MSKTIPEVTLSADSIAIAASHIRGAMTDLAIYSAVLSTRSYVASGVIDIQGEQISWAIDCGPSLFSIERKGEVEVVTYADNILYHGPRDGPDRGGNRSETDSTSDWRASPQEQSH